MRHFILVFGMICLLISCQSNKKRNVFTYSQISDSLVLRIVNETIVNDSLFFFSSIPVFEKFLPYQLDKVNSGIRIDCPKDIINMNDLIYFLRKYCIVDTIDSIYIASQIVNSVKNKISISGINFKSFNDKDSLKRIFEDPRKVRFYEFYYPLFNKNQTVAYLQYDYICPSCSRGNALILKKEYGMWKIVYKRERWSN